MFSKNELLDAIDDLEMAPATYQNAEKLATFYSLYDHLYTDNSFRVGSVREVMIGKYGDSEFLRTVEGMSADLVWPVIDELMDAVKTLQPRLYQAALDKLKG